MAEHMFDDVRRQPVHPLQTRARHGQPQSSPRRRTELPRVGLEDALEVCLLLRDQDPARFERAAVRWLGRFALEGRGVTIEALQRATGAFDAMPRRSQTAMEILASLCVKHGVDC